MPDRRVVLFLAVALAVATISPQGQGSAQTQAESKDLPLPGSVQRFDAPEPGARSPRNANYDIDVRLDHAARSLSGHQTIRWRNTSATPTSELQFHLYWNAWRNPDSTWLRERKMSRNYTAPPQDGWGAMDVSAVRLREPYRRGPLRCSTANWRRKARISS